MMRRLVPALMLLAIGWLTSGPSAQGLGDVARREAARRQQVTAGKKYTNEDLPAVAPASAPAPSESAAATPAAGPLSPPTGAQAASSGGASNTTADDGTATFDPVAAGIKSAEQKRGEQFWRDKARAVRSEVEKSRAKAEGLKKRLETLDEQLENGAGTSHVQERDVTLKAFEKAEYSLKVMQDEWSRLEARAQAAKVPAEWLR